MHCQLLTLVQKLPGSGTILGSSPVKPATTLEPGTAVILTFYWNGHGGTGHLNTRSDCRVRGA